MPTHGEKDIRQQRPIMGKRNLLIYLFIYLFACAYNVWVISPPSPPLIPSRNYFALISNFVVERV
jgi:hypothetical protein